MSTPSPAGYATGRILRPSAKSLPEHARSHNRALVLQTLYRSGSISRADLARATGLTRVTISDLVAQLIADDLIVELGQREDALPASRRRCSTSTAAVPDRRDRPQRPRACCAAACSTSTARSSNAARSRRGRDGQAAVDEVVALIRDLIAAASRPVLGIGVGSPGVVDLGGTVLSAPNLGFRDLPLQQLLADADRPAGAVPTTPTRPCSPSTDSAAR